MKLVVHQSALSERGDSVNAENISIGLQNYYGIESVITAPKSKFNNTNRIFEMKAKGINVQLYDDLRGLWKIAEKFEATHAYFMLDGHFSNLWIPDTKHLSHCVFRPFEPHGDKYAYVSEWLFNKAKRIRNTIDRQMIEKQRAITGTPHNLNFDLEVSWVPHSVVPKFPEFGKFRSKYGFSIRDKIIGRIGGYDQFNDTAAMLAVEKISKKTPNVHFFFVNTKQFIQAPNVHYVDYLSESDKWSMYQDCDLFLNGRAMGESFGFSIVEPLMVGKPVLAPDQLRHPRMDAHHMHLLRPQNLTYFSAKGLEKKIYNLLENQYDSKRLTESVRKYSLSNSTTKFFDYFLN